MEVPEEEKQIDTKTLLILGGLLAVLFAGCLFVGGIALFFIPVSDTPEPPPVPTVPSENNSQNVSDSEFWSALPSADVEGICLEEARDVAEQQGAPRAFVYSCGCSSRIDSETASFDCQINAIDGEHSLNIACVRVDGVCALRSELGTQMLTFVELALRIQ